MSDSGSTSKSFTPDSYYNTPTIVDDILNDNTNYLKTFNDFNDALQAHDTKSADRNQIVLDAYFNKYNEVNRKLQSDLKINKLDDIDRTQKAIGKLAAQNPNFSTAKPLYLSTEDQRKKQTVISKLDKLLKIYPDYDAVYNYLTSDEGSLEIAENPEKLNEIINKINVFLLQYPLAESPDKFKDTPILDLSLKEIYKNTIQTAIDIINDIANVVSRRDTLSKQEYRRSIFRTITEDSRRMYVGIWLIFFSFVLYFIDSSV